MVRVTLDNELRKKLLNLQEPLELCEADGKVVGRVTPVTLSEPQLTEEELQRREKEPDFSTEEVLSHLEKL